MRLYEKYINNVISYVFSSLNDDLVFDCGNNSILENLIMYSDNRKITNNWKWRGVDQNKVRIEKSPKIKKNSKNKKSN